MNSFQEPTNPSSAHTTPDSTSSNNDKPSVHARLCIICRKMSDRNDLIRLTADCTTSEIKLNAGNRRLHGRSAYLCANEKCVASALKGTRLKVALEGRKGKNVQNRRSVKWPLEPQLMQEITEQCTEPSKTCQNTER